jgi:hypothetical protein
MKILFSSVLRYPSSVLWLLLGLVVMARGKTPDPIPNSAVKTLSADGTAA